METEGADTMSSLRATNPKPARFLQRGDAESADGVWPCRTCRACVLEDGQCENVMSGDERVSREEFGFRTSKGTWPAKEPVFTVRKLFPSLDLGGNEI